MTTFEFTGDWNTTNGKLKQKWAQLADNDLQYFEGRQQELLENLQKITGEIQESGEQTIKKFNLGCGCN